MPKILIVEDDYGTRQILGNALEPLEFQLFFSSDGIHALDILRCNPGFDLIITDISMPVLDGRQLIGTLAKEESLASIPVIIMSGIVSAKEIADLLEQGAAKFLPKPPKAEILRDEVLSCLEMVGALD